MRCRSSCIIKPLNGVVVSLTDYGAFVELEDGAGWIFLLHGGLPAVLDARPVSGVWAFDAEWIPDPVAGRVVYGIPDAVSDPGEITGFTLDAGRALGLVFERSN